MAMTPIDLLGNVSDPEIVSILRGSDGTRPIRYRWECTLRSELGDCVAHAVRRVSIIRDYLSAFADQSTIDLQVPPGDFDEFIYPMKEDFEVIIRRIPVQVSPDDKEFKDLEEVEVKHYVGFLLTPESAKLDGDTQTSQSREGQNTASIRPVSIGFMEKGLQQLRTLPTGGILRDVTPAEALRYFLVKGAQQITVDLSDAITGIDVVDDVAMPKRTKQLIIDHMTPLKDVPKVIHRKLGVYFTGMGRYFQNQKFYVYPTYDITRFDKAPRKLTVLNLPDNMMKGLELTYREKDRHLYILSTEETKSLDTTHLAYLNSGNGVRYTQAKRLMTGMLDVSGNEAIADRRLNNAEFITDPVAGGLNYAPLSDEPVTSSEAYQASKLAIYQVMPIQIGWDAAMPWKITPGMAVRYLSPEEGKLVARYGTVVGVQSETISESPTVVAPMHRTSCAVTVMVSREGEPLL